MEPSNQIFHHPYTPYTIQLDFMQKLYQCIEDSSVGIFESPTGTGKSLSLICAALTWLRDNERRQLLGNSVEDEDLDWLVEAERKAKLQSLCEARRESETKLAAIRDKNAKHRRQQTTTKKPKIDDQIQEQDLILADYESDNERSRSTTNKDQSLSSSTLALLEQLAPKRRDDSEISEDACSKIIFCSRTHSQLTQFVNELRKVDVPSSLLDQSQTEGVKHVPLGSRKNLCINPKVSRLPSTAAISDRCLELQKPGISREEKCQFLPSNASLEDRERLSNFKDNVLAQLSDIEDIGALGHRLKLCPYYASRSAVSPAEILTLPYPLLLQKSAREALGIDLKQNVVIVDEAHNLTSAIADTLSVAMPLSHLELAQSQVFGYCQKFKNKLKGKNRVYLAQIIKIMKSCLSRIEQARTSGTTEIAILANELISGSAADQIQPGKLVKYIQESKLVFKVEAYAELQHQQNEGGPMMNPSDAPKPKGVLAEFQSLLVALMNPATEGRFFICRDNREFVLKYTLLDAQAHFEDVVKEARAVILAGGTMSPMSDWSEQLFPFVDPTKLKTYSFDHIIDKANILVQPLLRGPNGVEFDFTFTNRKSERMVIELGCVVEKLCATAPDGMVIFFPSYDYLAFVAAIWNKTADKDSLSSRISKNKAVFQESKDVDTDGLLKDYSNAVISGKGALMLAIVGGKLSEGINFSDTLGRVVMCVGIPYPNIKSAEWKAKVDYVERKKYGQSKQAGFSHDESKARAQTAAREYSDNTTMRAVNQSIGRAIRHKNDYAAIYLTDKRYATSRIQAKLPQWLKGSIHDAQAWEQVEGICGEFFASKEEAKISQ